MQGSFLFSKLYPLFLLVTISIGANGQHKIVEYTLDLHQDSKGSWIQEMDVTSFEFSDFIAFSLVINAEIQKYEKFSLSIQTKYGFHTIPPFGEDPNQVNAFISELIFLTPDEAGQCHLIIECDPTIDLSNIQGKIRFFAPENKTAQSIIKEHQASPRYFTCPCPQPNYIPRANWGASFKLTGDIYKAPAIYTNVTHLIVHHSAGTNVSNNWAGVAAAVFDFHVNTNGWQDVGYNWLIDPNGVIYEGRGGGDNVRGAHMCGYNSNTMGVCLLGNFQIVQPTDEMMGSLSKLLAWKACKENINPEGSGSIVSHTGYMQNISGHKDGCSPNYTECPGTNVFSKLPSLRLNTVKNIHESCGELSSLDVDIDQKKIFISPNPSEGYFSIQGLDGINLAVVDIYDITGKWIQSHKNILSNQTIDITSMKEGIYIVKIDSKSKSYFLKMAKI